MPGVTYLSSQVFCKVDKAKFTIRVIDPKFGLFGTIQP